jgi:uncharacterized membrane protein
MFYGIFLFVNKSPIEQKQFSIINFGIGAFVGVIITIFIIGSSRNEKSKERRQLEQRLQETKKTSQAGMFFCWQV